MRYIYIFASFCIRRKRTQFMNLWWSFFLVHGDKLTLSDFYESMDTAKKLSNLIIWGRIPTVMKTMWRSEIWLMINGLGCYIVPFTVAPILNPTIGYSHNDFNGKVMEGSLTWLHRMVPKQEARKTINLEMEMYRAANRKFGFVDVVQERSILTFFLYFLFTIVMKCNLSFFSHLL